MLRWRRFRPSLATPINRADKNTFYAFGAEEDAIGLLEREDPDLAGEK